MRLPRFVNMERTSNYYLTTQAAAVELDSLTGRIELLKTVTAHDCRKAVSSIGEGQLETTVVVGRDKLSMKRQSLKEVN